MAKDSILTGAVEGSGNKNKGTKATPKCTYDGVGGYAKRKGGRFPEVTTTTGTQGRLDGPTKK